MVLSPINTTNIRSIKKSILLITFSLLTFLPNPVFSQEDILDSFPKYFISGKLETGVDCEHIDFMPDGKFIYKFTGDCKGWGRRLKGTWKKDNNKLTLSATLREDKKEGEAGCAGSYYHENTLSEKKVCFAKYKTRIQEKFEVFPAIFDLTGSVWVTEEGNIAVSIQTTLNNNPKKGRVKGLMNFEDLDFGKFSNE